jgi:hypothetical protein
VHKMTKGINIHSACLQARLVIRVSRVTNVIQIEPQRAIMVKEADRATFRFERETRIAIKALSDAERTINKIY